MRRRAGGGSAAALRGRSSVVPARRLVASGACRSCSPACPVIGLGLWLPPWPCGAASRSPLRGERSAWRSMAPTAVARGSVVIRQPRPDDPRPRPVPRRRRQRGLRPLRGSKYLLSSTRRAGVAGGWSGLTWMAVVGCTSAVLGIVVPWWFMRHHGDLSDERQRHWIAGLIVVQVTALLVMAATGSFLVAAAASLLIARVRSLRNGLIGAWIVPLTPRQHRATVLSTLEQADSISQVTIGPVMGVIGQTVGIPAALAASAALLAPSAGAVMVAEASGRARHRPSPRRSWSDRRPRPRQPAGVLGGPRVGGDGRRLPGPRPRRPGTPATVAGTGRSSPSDPVATSTGRSA